MNRWRSYRDWSLKSKLLIIISALLAAAVLSVVTLNYVRYSAYLTSQNTRQTQQLIEQVSINVNTYMDELFRLAMSPYYDNTVMRELENPAASEESQLDKRREIEGFLGSVMTLPRKEILRVYILTDDSYYSSVKTPYEMADSSYYTKSDWYQQAKKSQSQIFLPVHTERVFGKKGTRIFSIVQSLRSKNDSRRVLGVIKVDASYSGIKSICDKVQLSRKSSLFILDDDQNIVYQNSTFENSPTDKNFYKEVLNTKGGSIKTINGTRYVVNTSRLTSTGWTVAFVNSFEALNLYSAQTRNASFVIGFLCILPAVTILFLFIRGFLRPVSRIVTGMKAVEGGDLSIRVPVESHDETGYLSESFNQMISRIGESMERNTQLVKEVYEAHYLQKEAQYDTLCAQIKPHFLYNMLNTISILVKCGEYTQAIEDIENLSFFLRGVMNVDKEIPLSSELQIIKAYLDLQKSRYGSRLLYQILIPDEFLTYRIPALSVEPLVENAVVHGCERKSGPSHISITVTHDSQILNIHIRDDGVGIEPEQLSELNDILKHETMSENRSEKDIFTDSIGLLNVNKRIKLIFGLDYGLSIDSVLNKGTEATLSIPLIQGIKRSE